MSTIINLLISGAAILITAYLLPGVEVSSLLTAIIVAIALAIANAIVRPILVFLTLPINILTLGLFIFVINAIIILLVAAVIPGFRVRGFGWALLFSLVLSVIHALLYSLVT